jgi:hypothetical protein
VRFLAITPGATIAALHNSNAAVFSLIRPASKLFVTLYRFTITACSSSIGNISSFSGR